MPRIDNQSQNFPDWSEIDFYEIISLGGNGIKNFTTPSSKQILFVCEGKCSLEIGNKSEKISSGGIFQNFENQKSFSINNENDKEAMVIIIGGNWTDETGGCGVFSLSKTGYPKNIGDPSFYWRNTDFDNHYHDCDEYWIFYSGNGIAVSEENIYGIEPGICIATKTGDHHDIPVVNETLRGVYFETSLKGKKRLGHLWNHTYALKENQNEL
jgi:mannose-6-phosphate isomerase-like protein (cupin superfamily)